MADEDCRQSEGCTGIECVLPRAHPDDHEGSSTESQTKYVGYSLFVRWPRNEFDGCAEAAAPNQTADQPAQDDGLRHRIVRALWDAADICLTDEQLRKMADAVIEDVMTQAVDSELRDRIARAGIAKFREYTGTKPDQNMWNLDVEKTFHLVAEDQALVVADALKATYLNGHDSGYAAANVADPWAEQQTVVDSELRGQVAAAIHDSDAWVHHRTSTGVRTTDFYAQLADEALAVVAPVLAERDAALERHRFQLDDALGIVGAEEDIDPYEAIRAIIVEYDKANEQRQSLSTELRAALALHTEVARDRDQLRAELDALKGEAEKWHRCASVLRLRLDASIGGTRQYAWDLHPDVEPHGQPDTEATERDEAYRRALIRSIRGPAASTPATPTEPRVWRIGDPEPTDVYEVVDGFGKRWSRRHDGFWVNGDGFSHWQQLLLVRGNVTEVVEAPGGETP